MEEFNRHFLVLAVAMAALCSNASDMSLFECKDKATQGDAEAMWQLGQRYEKGDGVRKDNLKAVSQYRKAAEKKHRKACERLAELYETGRIVGKNPVKAAKFRAIANGDNGELAAVQAKTEMEKRKEDEIETALDYILGRNGKAKDPKTGIRILYAQAKDKPVAQRVFVNRWSQGDLDDALGVISKEEWDLLIPWFNDAWNRGNKASGLILGNEAYRNKRYKEALSYWEGSGLAKAWYFVGRFYSWWGKEGEGGGPKYMQNETLARKAYEKCLKIDSGWDDAKFDLGIIYIFASQKANINYAEALKIFSYFLKKDSNDKYFNYDYGYAGFWMNNDKLVQLKSEYGNASAYRRESIQKEYNRVLDVRDGYVRYIRKSANMGYEAAQKFIRNFDSNK